MNTLLPKQNIVTSEYSQECQLSGRKTLLSFIESLVELGNSKNFDSMTSLLAMSCNESVVVDISLQSVANNKVNIAVSTNEVRVLSHVALRSNSQSIALIWIVLHAADIDSEMVIIDKRVCYRNYKTKRNSTRKSNVKVRERASMKSVLEVVVELRSSCEVEQSLQEVLPRVAVKHSSDLLHAQLAASACHCHFRSSLHCCSALTTVTPGTSDCGRYGTASTEPNISNRLLAKHGENGTCFTTEGQRWRYLIEFRLQFDEHDLVTHWTTAMLAAEPEDVFR
jgi:hypothetical protein